MRTYIFVAAITVLGALSASSAIRVAPFFCNDMVIQRDVSAPIWGTGAPGEKISITASWGAAAETVADDGGKWMVPLSTPPAGGPFTITVQGSNTIVLNNVLSGDVWLCSGQSNMDMPMSLWGRAPERSAKAIAVAGDPELRLFKIGMKASQTPRSRVNGHWRLCTSASVSGFSAAGYFFGQKLRSELNVAVGLIQSTWGGTGIEAWTPLDKQIQDPAVAAIKAGYDRRAEAYDLAAVKTAYVAAVKKWGAEDAAWRKAGSKGRPPKQPQMETPPLNDQNYPGNLYNGMIYPIVPFAMKGVIWYQGENNTGRCRHYEEQLGRLIASWRSVWKNEDLAFHFVQLPNFHKPWTGPVENGDWAVLREAFLNVNQSVRNTGMAITIDVGNADDIHPENKWDVGERLALIALYQTYGRTDGVWSGPVFESCEFKDGRAVVSFNTGGAPLAFKGDSLKGFALVGESGAPVYADAVIEKGNTVVVSSPEVKKASRVYYAWADNPTGANLINEGGLPSSPFRWPQR